MKGVSIILTAYHTEKFIKPCLDSIKAQTYFKTHKNYEILLGIDGCEETLNKVKEIHKNYPNLEVYYFENNVGTYIVSNTLCSIAKYDTLIRFDSDDIMLKDMVERMVKCADENNSDFLLAKTKDLNGTSSYTAQGHILIRKDVFEKYGGFRPFRCACDYELRIRLSKFVKVKFANIIVSQCRTRQDSLTKKKDTSMASSYRNNIHGFIRWETTQLKKKEDAVIKCVVENPKKLLDDDTLSETIEVNVPENPVSKNLYEAWQNLPEKDRKVETNNTSGRYIKVKACSGFNVFY